MEASKNDLERVINSFVSIWSIYSQSTSNLNLEKLSIKLKNDCLSGFNSIARLC